MGIQDYNVKSVADINDAIGLYNEKREFLSTYYDCIEPVDFYRDLFPVGSFERKGIYDDKKPNGIACTIYEKGKARHTTITDEHSELQDIDKEAFTIISPISYFGNRRKSERAAELYAITFDIDGIGIMQLRDLIFQMDNGVSPRATYIVLSGAGVHLYYVFEQAIALNPSSKIMLAEVKKALLPFLWNRYTSTIDKPQKQSLFQGFRMVGTSSKMGLDYPVVAYELGERVALDYIIDFIPERDRRSIDINTPRMSLAKAKELYPLWYQLRVVEGIPAEHWHCNRAVYDWWKKKIFTGAAVGHRYYCIMCLAAYAVKCDISEEELRKDAYSFLERFDSISIDPRNRFCADDIEAAMQLYNDRAATIPTNTISDLSGIDIPKNKRNPIVIDGVVVRKSHYQRDHLEDARYAKKKKKERGEGSRNKGGRPSEEAFVKEYRALHPYDSKAKISRDTGLSYPTILKYTK